MLNKETIQAINRSMTPSIALVEKTKLELTRIPPKKPPLVRWLPVALVLALTLAYGFSQSFPEKKPPHISLGDNTIILNPIDSSAYLVALDIAAPTIEIPYSTFKESFAFLSFTDDSLFETFHFFQDDRNDTRGRISYQRPDENTELWLNILISDGYYLSCFPTLLESGNPSTIKGHTVYFYTTTSEEFTQLHGAFRIGDRFIAFEGFFSVAQTITLVESLLN